jgi:glutaconyl-CoA decarboxylase
MKNYTITVNGNVYQVSVEEGTSGVASAPAVQAPKVAIAAPTPVAAPAPVAPTPAKPAIVTPAPVANGANGNIKVNAPMPGKIIAIKANVGQAIKKGQVLVILEAMKMENEIVAPSDGTVASINVTGGSSVESGQLLATLS